GPLHVRGAGANQPGRQRRRHRRRCQMGERTRRGTHAADTRSGDGSRSLRAGGRNGSARAACAASISRPRRVLSRMPEETMRMYGHTLAVIVAATLALGSPTRAGEPDWPDDLTIGAASPGGTYYAYGAGLARILTRELGLPVVMRPTEGPAENIALMESG